MIKKHKLLVESLFLSKITLKQRVNPFFLRVSYQFVLPANWTVGISILFLILAVRLYTNFYLLADKAVGTFTFKNVIITRCNFFFNNLFAVLHLFLKFSRFHLFQLSLNSFTFIFRFIPAYQIVDNLVFIPSEFIFNAIFSFFFTNQFFFNFLFRMLNLKII